MGCWVVDEDDGELVDANGLVGVERMDLLLALGGWPVWTMRLVGRAAVRLVVVIIVDEALSWHQGNKIRMFGIASDTKVNF